MNYILNVKLTFINFVALIIIFINCLFLMKKSK